MGIAIFLAPFVPILLLYSGFLEVTSRKSTKLTGSQMRLILYQFPFNLLPMKKSEVRSQKSEVNIELPLKS